MCPALLPGPPVAAGSSRMGGSWAAQSSAARGHRVRNRQPLGGWIGDGGSPLIVAAVRAAPGSVLGTESRSARV